MKEKIIKIENAVLNFIRKHSLSILLVIVTLTALYLRLKLFNFETDDYKIYLSRMV